MNTVERIEAEILKTGAELHRAGLLGLKAITIKAGNKTAIFADTDDLKGTYELQTAIAHEYGHVASGAVYQSTSDQITIARQELRADRTAIHKFLPIAQIKKAMRDGDVSTWQLSDRFGFTERFIQRAIEIYRQEGKL